MNNQEHESTLKWISNTASEIKETQGNRGCLGAMIRLGIMFVILVKLSQLAMRFFFNEPIGGGLWFSLVFWFAVYFIFNHWFMNKKGLPSFSRFGDNRKNTIKKEKNNDEVKLKGFKKWATNSYIKKNEKNMMAQGSQLALEMGLWNEKEDIHYVEKKETGVGNNKKVEYIRGKYSAYARKTIDGDIMFGVNVAPPTLTHEELIKKAERIADDYGVIKVRDVRKTKNKGQFVDEKGYGMRFANMVSVIMAKTNPLKNPWILKSSDEMKFDPQNMAVYNAVDEDGELTPLSFKEVSGMVIGGIPGSGKSAGLITSLVPMLKSGLVELTVIDGKGGDTEWVHFSKIAKVTSFKTDIETGEGNYEEIANLLQDFNRKAEIRKASIKDKKGVSNFWNAEITKDMPFRMIVIDECQILFDTTGVTREEREQIEKIKKSVAQIVRVYRSVGCCAVLLTQKPTSDSIPSSIRDNAKTRVAFKLNAQTAEYATLGEAKDNETIFATDISPEDKGTAVVSDDAGNRKFVRYAYLKEEILVKELNQLAQEIKTKAVKPRKA